MKKSISNILITAIFLMIANLSFAQVIKKEDVIQKVDELKRFTDQKLNQYRTELNELFERSQNVEQNTGEQTAKSESLLRLTHDIEKISSELKQLGSRRDITFAVLDDLMNQVDRLSEQIENKYQVAVLNNTELNSDEITNSVQVENQNSSLVNDAWMRIDGDQSGIYFWFGGMTNIGDVILAHEIIYFPQTNYFETEIGPYISFGEELSVLPMVGIYLNLSSGETEYFLPQVYFYSTLSNLYFEAWNMYYHGMTSNTRDFPFFYGRYFLKISINNNISVGPYAELTVDLAENATKRISSLPVGMVFGIPYGEGNSLDFFIGSDTQNYNQFHTRITFIHSF